MNYEMMDSPALENRQGLHNSQRRVLRYAETLDALFLLNEQSSPAHRQLCHEIATGTLADDANAWMKVLDAATSTVAATTLSSKPCLVSDLMRLHRRATSRFPKSLHQRLGQQSQAKQILEVWISYAHVQALYGTVDDARSTFKYIQNQNLGSTKASFYINFADFEEKLDIKRAIEVIKSGIEQKAEPISDLLLKLHALESSTVKNSVEKRRYNLVPPLASSSSALFSSGLKRKSEQGLSPKCLKKIDSSYMKTIATKAEENDDASNMSVGTDILSVSTREDNKEDICTASLSYKEKSLSSVPEYKIENVKESEEPNSKAMAAIPEIVKTPKIVGDANSRPSSTKAKRSSLLAKASRAGLGQAVRITHSGCNNQDTNDCSDEGSSIALKSKSFASIQEATKISRMDLSYMLQWDPTKRTSEISGNLATAKSSTIIADKTKDQPLTKIDELSSRASAVTVSSSISGSLYSGNRSRSNFNDSNNSTHLNENGGDNHTFKPENGMAPNQVEQQSSPTSALVAAQHNVDFLPLVNESNILRVNGTPYVKLGVLGKGGSCKVYRALSKDCTVLAIKKVKLGGMDRKAIDGYANEIALLKRLRGNPAIIQMYDSEVDLSRKAIFLVMEVGEVDLNFVLQQQAVNASSKTAGQQHPLNMNFIRLTWQQMLNAVHCIHDERIIHGDLKPANFLFVRGALKLIDFGIAKAIQSDDTTNIYRDSQIGTLNYMSPEAILDTGSGSGNARMKCGTPSDIWSLGCILYQMVYGQTPFAQLHMISKLQAIVNPNYVIDFPDHADEAAIDAMRQCLRRRAEDRPPIVGKHGLLNEHCFLNSRRKSSSNKQSDR